jgi:hypothetical protein
MEPEEALAYLKEKGFTLAQRTYYDKRKEIIDSRFDRLSQIAKEGFVDQHLERIQNLEMINEEMWRKYRAGDYKAMEALCVIMELQPYLSAFYDASKKIMEDNIEQFDRDKDSKQEATGSISISQ